MAEWSSGFLRSICDHQVCLACPTCVCEAEGRPCGSAPLPEMEVSLAACVDSGILLLKWFSKLVIFKCNPNSWSQPSSCVAVSGSERLLGRPTTPLLLLVYHLHSLRGMRVPPKPGWRLAHGGGWVAEALVGIGNMRGATLRPQILLLLRRSQYDVALTTFWFVFQQTFSLVSNSSSLWSQENGVCLHT